MNNPYLPLSNYFRGDQRASNYYKSNENDVYMPYVRQREAGINQFTPASNFNNDNLTEKIGRETSSLNRIPYQMFNKDNSQNMNRDPYLRYQRDFNDYDSFNKKIYYFSIPPNTTREKDYKQYQIEPIDSIEYDRNIEENKKLSQDDYRKYFDYMNRKISTFDEQGNNINPYQNYNNKVRKVNHYVPSGTLSVQYTPPQKNYEDPLIDTKEYQRKIREREEQLINQYRVKKGYHDYYPDSNLNMSYNEDRDITPRIERRAQSGNISCYYNRKDNEDEYPNIMSKIARKNLIATNPYTEKKMDIGQSSLPINPIVYPVNSYHYDYQRLKSPNWKSNQLCNSFSY